MLFMVSAASPISLSRCWLLGSQSNR